MPPTDISDKAVKFAITVCKNGGWTDTADVLRVLLDERNMSERQSLAMRDSADRTTAEVMRLEARELQWRELVTDLIGGELATTWQPKFDELMGESNGS